MYVYERSNYVLLMSYDPCSVFDYFEVEEMHGLNKKDCCKHLNNTEQAYIAGWCNLSPIDNSVFVFINLSRCTDDIHTMGLVFHEMMHCSGHVFNDNWIEYEEEMITWAENESYEITQLIKLLKNVK